MSAATLNGRRIVATLAEQPRSQDLKATRRPRLGFLGAGWIGRNRMEAIAQAGVADIATIVEPNQELAAEALKIASRAEISRSLDEMFENNLDGAIIATPSALHAEQAIQCLE